MIHWTVIPDGKWPMDAHQTTYSSVSSICTVRMSQRWSFSTVVAKYRSHSKCIQACLQTCNVLRQDRMSLSALSQRAVSAGMEALSFSLLQTS